MRDRQHLHLLEQAGFTPERFEKAHLPLGLENQRLERRLARRLGFYLFSWSTKR